MARTPSNMLPLGTLAPSFKLLNPVEGVSQSLQELKSDKGTVIIFMCNHCPFVKHVMDELVNLAAEYQQKGIAFIAINANDAEQYPDDSPAHMKELAHAMAFSFPYLYDETQEVAKAYEAACTPDFFLFDGDLRLVYRGQLDDSRPGSEIPVTGQDLRKAMDQVLSGEPVFEDQKPSLGCNIKWKA
ncbi:thioredoxin family protein [Marinicrinis sediminis]|uniref:Thioredoxin family protein n=1 Tax=Marinicrinis sediminis TaxID=1652465 RepID=A0ABW5RDI9_9BACL